MGGIQSKKRTRTREKMESNRRFEIRLKGNGFTNKHIQICEIFLNLFSANPWLFL